MVASDKVDLYDLTSDHPTTLTRSLNDSCHDTGHHGTHSGTLSLYEQYSGESDRDLGYLPRMKQHMDVDC